MGLIIDDLAKIIRKHQKTLPCVEPLDVDDKFEKIYKISGWRPRIKIQTGLKKYYKCLDFNLKPQHRGL